MCPNFSKALTRQSASRGWCQQRGRRRFPPPLCPGRSAPRVPPPPERSECAASPRGTRPPPRPCSATGRAHRRPPRATYPLSRGWCAGHSSRGSCALTARRGRTCGQRPGRSRSSARRRRSWHPRCARSLRPHREEAARGDKWLAQRFQKGDGAGQTHRCAAALAGPLAVTGAGPLAVTAGGRAAAA